MPETDQVNIPTVRRPTDSPYRRAALDSNIVSNKVTDYNIDPKQKQNDIIFIEKHKKSRRSTGSQTRHSSEVSEDFTRKIDVQTEDDFKEQKQKRPKKSSATNTEDCEINAQIGMEPFKTNLKTDDYDKQNILLYRPDDMIDLNGTLYRRVSEVENVHDVFAICPQEEKTDLLSSHARRPIYRKPEADPIGRDAMVYQSENMIDFENIQETASHRNVKDEHEENNALLLYHFQEDSVPHSKEMCARSTRGEQERHLVMLQDDRLAAQGYRSGRKISGSRPIGSDMLIGGGEEFLNFQHGRRPASSPHRRSAPAEVVEDMIDLNNFGYYQPERFSSWPRYHPHFHHYQSYGDRVQAILNMSNAYLHRASTLDYREMLQYRLVEEEKQRQNMLEKKPLEGERRGYNWHDYEGETLASYKRHHQKQRPARRTFSADRYYRQHQPSESCRRYSSAGEWLQQRGSETEEEDDEDEDDEQYPSEACRCSYNDQHQHYRNHRRHPRLPSTPSQHRAREEEKSENEEPMSPPAPRPVSKPEVTFYPHTSSTPSSTSAASGTLVMVGTPRRLMVVLVVLLVAVGVGVSVPLALRSGGRGRDAALQEHLEVATRLLHEVPLVDGHNDLPWNIRKFLHNRLRDFPFGEDLRKVAPWSNSPWSHTDLPRLKAGLIAAQFWAAYVPCESQYLDAVQLTLEQIDVIRRLTDKYYPSLILCTSAAEIKDAHSRGQLCSLIGVEGGHSLASSLPVLRTLYSVGVRYLTLTSNCNTPWADSLLVDSPGKKPEHNGLTNFGKSVVKEMNRLGMLVDLAHVAVRTMTEALDVSRAPVIFSHSSARALCNSTRNVPDHVLEHVGRKGGLVMVNFYSKFLTCHNKATAEDAIAHINHVRKVAGINSVGLGAGYDGINFTPQGLDDVSSYPTLFAALIATGQWSIDDLKKLAGLNFLRVMQEVEKVRDTMKAAGVGPYEDDDTNIHPSQKNCSSTNLF